MQINLILCTSNWITVVNVCTCSDFTEGFVLFVDHKSCPATQLAEVETGHPNGGTKGYLSDFDRDVEVGGLIISQTASLLGSSRTTVPWVYRKGSEGRLVSDDRPLGPTKAQQEP